MASNAAVDQAPPADEEVSTARLSGLAGYWFRIVWKAILADYGAAMEDLGLSPIQVSILSVIDETPGLNQGQYGRALGIQRANMVNLVGGLMDRGLIERREVPGDRRAFALHLTGEGEAVLGESYRRIEAHEARMFAPLGDDERRALLDMLKRVEFQSR